MAYTHNPNHAEEAVALLHSQHEFDDDLKNLLRALMKPFQDLEDALPGLYTAFDLDNILTSLIEDTGNGDRDGPGTRPDVDSYYTYAGDSIVPPTQSSASYRRFDSGCSIPSIPSSPF